MCATCRALLFASREALDGKTERPTVSSVAFWHVARDVAFDLPCALFFTAYALLVLFWAEIYLRARGAGDTAAFAKNVFFLANVGFYLALAAVWAAGAFAAGERTRRALEACAAGVVATGALAMAALFAKYGGSLFRMLRRFPPQFKGRRRKLREVGTVTAVCALCFSARAAAATADAAMRMRESAGGKYPETAGGFLDAVHPATPAVDVAYYAVCELLPAATALIVLRKLPPRPAAPRAARGDEHV